MFNEEQMKFIENQMDLCIKGCKEYIKEYRHQDRTTRADDTIELAEEIKRLIEINRLNKKFINGDLYK